MPVTFSMQQLVECYIDPLGSRFKEGYQDTLGAFLFGSVGKECACNSGYSGWSLGWEECSFLENSMDRGAYGQSMESQRVRHDWAINTFTSG